MIINKLFKWMGRNGLLWLRLSIGFVFLWYGVLKFFPGLSPAEEISQITISKLTFGIISGRLAVNLLAVWEVLIGLIFLVGKFMKTGLILLFMQMIGTFTPLFLFTGQVFTHFPYAMTLEGQYIVKNLVLISAGMVIAGRTKE